MKNIVFIINSIGSGGAESALFNVLKSMPTGIRSNANVHLVILDDEPRLKDIPSNLVVHQLHARRSMFKSVWQCYELFCDIKPDIVISFLVRANIVNSILRMLGRYKASIACERMHLSSHLALQFDGIKLLLAKCLPKLLYNRNDLLLGVSSGVSDDLIERFRVTQEKVKTIYNPYDAKLLRQRAQAPLPEGLTLPTSFMVSVGRLTKSKDQVSLLKGFAKSKSDRNLVIIGTGNLQENLVELAKQLGVYEKVLFTGYLDNPHAVIDKADFFISTSRNEGFPNALLESMVLGKPIIFTSCDSGPAEILGQHQHYKATRVTECDYGILIPEGDENAVKLAIDKFDQPELMAKYRELSLQRAQDFTLVKIASKYWDEINRLLK